MREAQNGREAVRQIDPSDEVDLMIGDLAMLEQEGIETIKRPHRIRPGLKIIAMSGQFAGLLLPAAERDAIAAVLDRATLRDRLDKVDASKVDEGEPLMYYL